MRVIVCGCRTLRNRMIVDLRLAKLLSAHHLTIVHGGQRSGDEKSGYYGADYFAAEWVVAVQKHDWAVTTDVFPADWRLHGKAAGPMRNSKMAEAGADLCIAFWDGESHGTLDMIRKATWHRIPVEIVPVRT